MRNIEDIQKSLASYKTVMKRQGDFTLYASKYVEDVEVLLALVAGTPAEPATKKAPRLDVAPLVRKTTRKPNDSKT